MAAQAHNHLDRVAIKLEFRTGRNNVLRNVCKPENVSIHIAEMRPAVYSGSVAWWPFLLIFLVFVVFPSSNSRFGLNTTRMCSFMWHKCSI